MLVREGLQLGVGTILDGMGNPNHGRLIAQSLGLDVGGLGEGCRGDYERWNALQVEIGSVVQTARCA